MPTDEERDRLHEGLVFSSIEEIEERACGPMDVQMHFDPSTGLTTYRVDWDRHVLLRGVVGEYHSRNGERSTKELGPFYEVRSTHDTYVVRVAGPGWLYAPGVLRELRKMSGDELVAAVYAPEATRVVWGFKIVHVERKDRSPGRERGDAQYAPTEVERLIAERDGAVRACAGLRREVRGLNAALRDVQHKLRLETRAGADPQGLIAQEYIVEQQQEVRRLVRQTQSQARELGMREQRIRDLEARGKGLLDQSAVGILALLERALNEKPSRAMELVTAALEQTETRRDFPGARSAVAALAAERRGDVNELHHQLREKLARVVPESSLESVVAVAVGTVREVLWWSTSAEDGK